jgi:PAS domain S-box-containing protein
LNITFTTDANGEPLGATVVGHDITERKKIERTLLHHSFLINNITDAVIASDKDFKITFWNKSAEDVYGWKAEEVLGKRGPEILKTEFINSSLRESIKIAKQRNFNRAEVYHYSKDGRKLQIESFFTVILDNKGKIIEHISVNRDVTEQKKLEHEINLLARFPYENPNPILRVEKSGKLLYANNNSQQLLNFWKCSIGEFVPANIITEIINCFEHKQEDTIEIPCGCEIYSLNVVPVIDEDYVNIYAKNITEIKKYEKALKHSEENLRNILDATQEAIFLLDKNGVILTANETFAKRMHKTINEIIGHKFADFIEDENAQLRMSKLKQVFKSNKTERFEDIREGRYLEHHYFPYYKDGEVLYVAAYTRDITENKIAIEKLNQASKRLQLHFDNSPLAVVEWDSEYNVTMWSGQAEKIFGWKSSETVGKKIMDLNIVVEEDISIVNNTMKRLSSGKEFTVTSSNRNYTKTRTVIDCTWHNSVLTDESGRMTSVMSLVEDITESKKAAIALKESEERYRVLFENMLEGFSIIEIIYDTAQEPIDFKYLDVNPAFETQTGIKANEIVGKRFYEKFPEADRKWVEKYGKVAITKKPNHFEKKLEPLNRWFEVSAYPSKNGHVAVVFSDITNRKLAEEALKNSEEKYRELVENANSIILKMDTNGKFTYFNEFASNFFGFTEKEMIGKTGLETIVPEIDTSGRDLKKMLDALYKNPDNFVKNINENVKKNGERVLIEWHNKALFDSKGERIGHIAIGTDITERVKAELALKKYSMKLEILSETASRLLASENPQNLINELCLKVMHFLDCQVFFNYIIDKNYGKLHLNAYNGIPEKTAKDIEWLNFGKKAINQIPKSLLTS